jgi:hypothetical protein
VQQTGCGEVVSGRELQHVLLSSSERKQWHASSRSREQMMMTVKAVKGKRMAVETRQGRYVSR